ncbi:HdeD family acid-resistance protein [Nonomuraea gerenzanensis]|uniref:Probable conserved membrane protein n=1 Tax=Nonomuraea gerenzanensis TaxID=93944 RepID=A0A1M4EG77_9ACTN|nr:DUF308 domain-containing protein [Nonomuraea gerenzanensis]UBU09508.1 DUF308 domain-containing protein [Nonomuraea gerenzanensis]SBO97925.1 Probable conserved membrane protein [Nonomuraea gerenzanensis]
MTVRLMRGATGWAIAAGLLSLVLGLAVLIWPGPSIAIAAVLFGLQLIVLGIYRIVQALMAELATGGARVLYALLGVLSLAIGILAVRNVPQTVTVLAILMGLFWLLGGVIELVTVLGDRSRPKWGWHLVLPILAILVGIVILAIPSLSLLVLIWMLGIWLVTWGILVIVIMLWIRYADRQRAALAT